jgi:hypothetical protein
VMERNQLYSLVIVQLARMQLPRTPYYAPVPILPSTP